MSSETIANPATSGLDESAANGVSDERRRLMDVQLVHQTRAVRLGRLDADAKNRGDLLRTAPFRHELQDFAFAIVQRIRLQLLAAQKRTDHDAADARAEIRCAGGHLPQRV